MILKVIFLVIAGLFLFRLFGGKIPFIDKSEAPKKDEEHDFDKIEATSACATCGTYITEGADMPAQPRTMASALSSLIAARHSSRN